MRSRSAALIAVLSRHRCRDQVETRVLNLRQSAALPANANSFISVLLLGHIGSHMDITSGPQGPQAKCRNGWILAKRHWWERDFATGIRQIGRASCRERALI